jgi:hypothetical protein
MHRYEKAIADTARAVAALRADYQDLDFPSPSTYIDHLRDEYECSDAHTAADFMFHHHRSILMMPYFGLAMARMGLRESIAHTDVLFHGQQFNDGLVLGLAASNESLTSDFDTVMSEHTLKMIARANEMPQTFARRITAMGLETYELDLDCPSVDAAIGESERPQHLKTFADQLLTDLYDDETENKYFKIGLGIARHAYNSYVMLGDSNFAEIMTGVDFDFESPGED